ncbi:hypothetical protein PENSPDRAFT_759224 [Peniophora sp. CONT]|nr:hypothetical protein PENSPDRAFT_759224 [Peniophora sp. CONT]
MEMSSQGFVRASVESALVRRFQVLGEHISIARTDGGSSTLVEEYIADDMDYFRGLIPSYWLRLNRIRSPLLSLPPELLPMILDATASDWRTQLKTWIQLGHVCHDLRDALLRMHALWAEVVFDPRYSLVQEELLARAGSCPINISLGYQMTPLRVRRAVELLARARTVKVHSDTHPDQAKDILEALRRGPNLTLEVLAFSLHRHTSAAHGNTFTSADQPMLNAPKLRAVDFVETFIPLDMSFLCRLSLRWTSTEPTPVPDARTFADMISKCGRLEKLTLHGWIPACSALKGLCQSEYRISLPRLSHLVLLQDMEHILAFWDILNIPRSTAVHVDYVSAAEEEPACNLQELLRRTRSLRAFLVQTQRRGVSQISKIRVYCDDEHQIHVVLGITDSEPSHGTDSGSQQTPSRPWDSSSDFVLKFSTFTYTEMPDDVAVFLECLCTTLQLRVDSVNTVEFDWSTGALALDEQNQGSRILYTLFPAATALNLIASDPCFSIDIGSILGSSSPRGLDYFPNLQALHLGQPVFSQANVERLIDALNMRADHGQPVRVLTLLSCSDPEESDSDMEADERLFKRLEASVPYARFNVYG